MPVITSVLPGLYASALALLWAGAWSDLKRRIIPNGVCLALGLTGLGLRLADGSAPLALGLAVAVFLGMAAVWRCGMVGGGDVKLLAGCALLVPPPQVAALLMAVGLAGGLLALATLALRVRRTQPPRPTGPGARLLRIEAWRARRRAGLPYGCAIALGTVIVLAIRVRG